MPRRFEVLAGMLIERGHSARRIEKILGGNLTRVFGDLEGVGAGSARSRPRTPLYPHREARESGHVAAARSKLDDE